MQAILALLLTMIPKALLVIGIKLLSQKFIQVILEDLIIFALRQGAKLSATPYDDALVEKMAIQIKQGEKVEPQDDHNE